MRRKILCMILTGIICVLLITGCSPQGGDNSVSGTDTTKIEEQKEPSDLKLPSDARILIRTGEGSDEFTKLYTARLKGYLLAAGVPEENIINVDKAVEELAQNAKDLLKDCTVLIVGNAEPEEVSLITKAAHKMEIPVHFFGTDPDETQRALWEKQNWKVSWVRADYSKAAEKRAADLEAIDFSKIDHDENEEIGAIVLGRDSGKIGAEVNEKALELLGESSFSINILDDGTEEEEDEENEEEFDSEREEAREQVISMMDEYGKELELILCADDEQALGAWDAVRDEKRKVGHDVMILGFDATQESLQEVASGNIAGTFFNDFMGQARNSSDAVLEYIKGGTVPFEMLTEYVCVTIDNAQELLDVSASGIEEDSDEEESEEESEE